MVPEAPLEPSDFVVYEGYQPDVAVEFRDDWLPG
jgi:hypothetical protein